VSAEWKGEGIDPRFTLANERTFLAWNRTSLALIAGGFAVAELMRNLGDDSSRHLLGIPLMILGGIFSVCAEVRQRRVQRSMEAGKGVPESLLPMLMTIVLAAASVGAVLLTIFE
jgi:putative membrane protein